MISAVLYVGLKIDLEKNSENVNIAYLLVRIDENLTTIQAQERTVVPRTQNERQ